MQEWFSMGGYARYLWPSYGLGLALLWLNLVWARRSARAARQAALRRLATNPDENA